MRPPEVLLLDDGELDDVASLLEDLPAPYKRLRGGELRTGIPSPGRLLVATPRRVAALAEISELSQTPVRMVVSEADSEGQRAQLRQVGFNYLVRRPVHPEALRLLLLRCLYTGEDQRSDERVVVGSPVSIRSGLMLRGATLIDLSLQGCRLLVETKIPVRRRLRIQLPALSPDATGSTLTGRVVRVDPGVGTESPSSWHLGIAFEEPNDAARTELERCVAEHVHGPARIQIREEAPDGQLDPSVHVASTESLEEVRESTPASKADPSPVLGGETREGDRDEKRESARVRFSQRVPAYGNSALRVLMGRDLSTRGMRVEPHTGLELGDRVHLALYGDADEPPAMVWATIRRDDGDGGLVALFDPLPEDLAGTLESWVARLPAIESLQSGESQSLGAVLSEILTS